MNFDGYGKRGGVLCVLRGMTYLYKTIILMKILVASILSLIFFSLAVIHIYWGFGGKSGSAAAIPTKENNKPVISPGPVDCFVVGIALLSIGIFVLIKAGIILFGVPAWLLNCGLWVIAAVFFLRAIGEFKYIGFFKKIKTTRFAQMDSKFYSPLCLVVGILCVILEFTN
jgi:hypothetical protein